MKKNKTLRIVLYSLAILIVAGWLFVRNITNGPLPDYNQDIQLSGLQAPVEVIRDSFAIPHIYAENQKDLYMAVGVVMAQDRLWQMDLLRRVTTGRLAEILSDDLLEVDQLMRSLEMSKKSTRMFAQADPQLRECIMAFTDGVNQFIEQNQKHLPFEFKLLGYTPEQWEPIHSVNLIGYMAWDLSTGWPNELTLFKVRGKVDEKKFSDFVPNIPGQSTSVYPDFQLDKNEGEVLTALQNITIKLDELGLDVFRGSNNWVASGSKTKSGKPLLANDMHLGLSIPGIWYQMHQVIPGKLNVTGVVLPGQPMIVAGHNQNIAWGFTNVMTDGLDFYEETVNPDNPNEYLVDGEWRKFRIVEEQVLNKAGDTLVMINKFTHRGPIVTDIKAISGKTISMSWVGLFDSNELRTVYGLNQARNWTEFREAIKTFVTVNQNIVYADTEGNIGLHSTIGIPLRESGGIGVYPGDTSLYDWKGLVPFEELPFSFNPESGFLSSANNRTTDPDYPHYISSWFDLPYRQDRIQELLKSNDKIGIEDFIAIQADQHSKMAEKFNPVFVQELMKSDELTEIEKDALETLRTWDFSLSRESVAATIFEYMYFNTCKELVEDELGEELFTEFSGKKIMVKNFMENILINQESSWCDNIQTPDNKETFNQIVTSAFKKSLSDISTSMGSNTDKWAWGDIHQITLEHPLSSANLIDKLFNLSRGPYPVGGSFHTVCPYSYSFMDPGSINHGASHRHIFDLSDWDKSLTVIPTGNSGIPASPYYCDQSKLYVNNQYHSDYVSREKVEASAKYKIIITDD
ncbi:MAG: penicillin acylase family protein [Bacteroidales bacterium]|nr:penicillin acylase family protein [Bacteroidales bacterium]